MFKSFQYETDGDGLVIESSKMLFWKIHYKAFIWVRNKIANNYGPPNLFHVKPALIIEDEKRDLWVKIDGKAKFILKPFFGCPTCMASFWSVAFYWLTMLYFYQVNIASLIIYLFYIPVTATLATIINTQTDK